MSGFAKYEVGSEEQPTPRYGHSVTVDPFQNTAYLFGGLGSNGCMNDLWSIKSLVFVMNKNNKQKIHIQICLFYFHKNKNTTHKQKLLMVKFIINK